MTWGGADQGKAGVAGVATPDWAGRRLFGQLGDQLERLQRGRLRGDRVIDRIGEARLLALSLGSIAVGYVVLIVAPNALVALVAFALWGLGVSVMFPQIYLMAARMNPDRPGAGLAAMTLAQRIGFMTATSSMGALSAGVGYGWAFTTIVGVASVLWIAALSLSPKSTQAAHGAH
ncbi:MAG: MFS transporter [Actinobacteria bacterium]|nr:MFS transporter [Actinomycetota bacterium]